VDDLANKKLCPKGGSADSQCRDPNHYVVSNESHQYVWHPYVQNLGGGYVGVGADQNYTFIAWARSEYVWLMDYDAVIPWIHKMHRAFILVSPTGEEFAKHYDPKESKKSIQLLKETYAKDPDLKMILRAYGRYRGKFHGYFRNRFANPKQKAFYQYWLTTPKHYQHIRTLYQQGRIRMIPGDLLKEKSWRGAAEAAKKMGIVVRMAYFSNAEEFWPYSPFYRETFRIMPMDEKSLVLRTNSRSRWGSKAKSYFHYNLQHGLSYKRRLAERQEVGGHMGFRHKNAVRLMERFRIKSTDLSLSLIELPRLP
jgi:hypothetical protein